MLPEDISELLFQCPLSDSSIDLDPPYNISSTAGSSTQPPDSCNYFNTTSAGFYTNVLGYHLSSPPRLPPHSVCLSSNSSTTSDEVEEQQQLRVIDERKRRRMISNRESARRSRMRKQRQLDEMWSQVVRLRTENHDLLDWLSKLTENHDVVLQENARLKEEASDLRQMLTNDRRNGDSHGYVSDFKDLEDIPGM